MIRKTIIYLFTVSFIFITAFSWANCYAEKNVYRGKSYYQYGKYYRVLPSSKNYQEKGIASWYGRQFHLKRTSSGERYDMYQMTAAHKTLPLATKVLVTNLINGRQVIVRLNDRGPFISNRIIDLSYAAAKKLNMVGRGIAPVSVKAIS